MKLEELPEEFIRALPVLKKIRAEGFEAYFVGGCVRDVLLGREIHDIDIATSAYPEEIKAIFPHTIDIGIEHGTVLVLAGKTEAERYEVTTFRTESKYTDYRRPDYVDFVRDLSEDLKRRDFTINALALAPDGQVIDLFDGLQDLKEKRVRAVGLAEERFNEDALRIMRGMRFSASLNFSIEEKTFTAMKLKAHLLEKISIERIFIELDKLFLANDWQKGLMVLIKSKAWQYLPDFDGGALNKLINDFSEDFHFKNSVQAWAALLTRYDKIDTGAFLKKWKVSNDFIKAVSNVSLAYALEKWDLESIYQFGLETAQLVDDLKKAEGHSVNLDYAIQLNQELQIHDKSEILVTGNKLIQKFGIKPGPDLGKILKTIEAEIVQNKLNNSEEEIYQFVLANFIK